MACRFAKLRTVQGKDYYFCIDPLFPFKTFFSYLSKPYLRVTSRTFWDFLSNFSWRLEYGEIEDFFAGYLAWCIHEITLTGAWLIIVNFSPWDSDPEMKFVSWGELVILWLQGRIIPYRKREIFINFVGYWSEE